MTALTTQPKLNRLDVASMVTNPPAPVPWIVDGLVVRGCLTLLSGQPGLGKSLLTEAVALAATKPSGGTVASLRVAPCRVMIVDAENGQREIHRRVHALGLDASHVERLEIIEAEGFQLGADLGLLDAQMGEVAPDLLILDAFRSLWPVGDENKSEDVAPVLDALRNLVRRHQAGAILIHHSGKNGQTYRGSSAIGASVELAFILDRADGDPDRQRRRLRCEKSRPAPEAAPRWLRLASDADLAEGLPPLQCAEPFSEPERERAVVTSELVARIVAVITERGAMRRPDIAHRLDRQPSDGSLRRAVERAMREGHLVRQEDGTYELASHDDNAD